MKNIRQGKISKVDPKRDSSTVTYITSTEEVKNGIPLLQPYVGRGWGIRAGVEIGSNVLFEELQTGETIILGYQQDQKYFEDFNNKDAIALASPNFKPLAEGELVLQSYQDSQVFLDKAGSITLSTADGSSLVIDKQTDTISQLSVNTLVTTEASKISSGIIKRDLRSAKEKEEDLFIDSLIAYDPSSDINKDMVGADSNYVVRDQNATLTGVFDTEEGRPSVLDIPGISGVPQASEMLTNIKNPALTEHKMEVTEFSDGLASLNIFEQEDKYKKKGRIKPNLAGYLTMGTSVDEQGRMPRFDYVFGRNSANGHDVWKLPGVNDKAISVDFKKDPNAVIGDLSQLTDEKEWITNGIDKFNTAIALDLVLNSRGADSKGEIGSVSKLETPWYFRVDKEGLTKWNIPASTPLDEPFRNGRSLLWNSEGSITQFVGKEDNEELENLTGLDDTTSFMNVMEGRRERSWTLDLDGSTEWRMGKDAAGQSYMVQADGAFSFSYGKTIGDGPSVMSNFDIPGLVSPSKSNSRVGTSISGQTEGSIELNIGADDATNKQSLAIATSGVANLTLGEDDAKDSMVLQTAGNIRQSVVNGGHKIEIYSSESPTDFKDGIVISHGGSTQSVIQIDEDGVILLRNSLQNSSITLSAEGDITASNATGTKISLSSDGNISLGGTQASLDISPTEGIILRTPGGSINLDITGAVNIAANSGFSVAGPNAHLNTTSVGLGPQAPFSPFTVAAMGPGSLDPFTGNPCSVSGFPNITG